MDHQPSVGKKMDVLLKDGTLIDPSQGLHQPGSIAVKDGKILMIGKGMNK